MKILKYLAIGIVLIVVVVVALIYIRYDRTFEAPYPTVQISTDSATLAKGKSLVYGPAHCAHCHGPISEYERVERGEEVQLSGGFGFKLPFGTIYAPNITPDPETGIGNLSSDVIARSLRYGVGHDGRALFDFMPFYDLSERDLNAILSYLKTTEPVKNEVPENEWNFMGKMVRAFFIVPMGDGDVPEVPAADSTAVYGAYLANSIANCGGCHTPRDFMTGAYIGAEMSGGNQFEVFDMSTGEIIKDKHLVTPNLSPDPETGVMASWSKADFIKRFRQGRVVPGSPMPWGPFSRMSDRELKAIYYFLQTVEPAKNATPMGIQEGDPKM